MKKITIPIPVEEEVVVVEALILGIQETNFEVQVYDFIAHGVTSNYDGVLGLDFLKKRKFCLDLPNGEITIDIDSKK